MKWIEIPAQRVLEVTNVELYNEFELINSDGEIIQPTSSGSKIVLVRRSRDQRVFKFAAFNPRNDSNELTLYLTEV